MTRAVPLAALVAVLLLSSAASADPALTHFFPTAPFVCESGVDRDVSVTVDLDEPSRGKTRVTLGSSRAGWLVPPRPFLVPAGAARDGDRFVLRGGAPRGIYPMTASVDDVTLHSFIEIRDCRFRWERWRTYEIRDLWDVCLPCQDLRFNDLGELVARLRDRVIRIDRAGNPAWLDEAIGEAFEVRALDDVGRLGLAVDGATLVATFVGKELSVTEHVGFAVSALAHDGTLGGFVPGKGAALIGRDGLRYLPISAADARVTAINGLGWSIGTFQQGGALRSFLFDGAQLTVLPGLGGKDVHALAISATGHVVGSARDAQGVWRAFGYTRLKGTRDLGVAGRAIAVDASGNAVVALGQASGKAQASATLLVTGAGKVVPAAEIAEDAQVEELLGFTSSGKLVVRAIVDGKAHFVVMVPEER